MTDTERAALLAGAAAEIKAAGNSLLGQNPGEALRAVNRARSILRGVLAGERAEKARIRWGAALPARPASIPESIGR